MKDDFIESVARFKNFVTERGCSPNLIWVRPDDVLVDRQRRLLVKFPMPAESERAAQTAFENGVRRQLGVLFATLCQVPGGTCCCVWAPETPEEAEYHLMPEGGLKMSVRTGESSSEARVVKSSWYWQWLKWRHRNSQDQKLWLFG